MNVITTSMELLENNIAENEAAKNAAEMEAMEVGKHYNKYIKNIYTFKQYLYSYLYTFHRLKQINLEYIQYRVKRHCSICKNTTFQDLTIHGHLSLGTDCVNDMRKLWVTMREIDYRHHLLLQEVAGLDISIVILRIISFRPRLIEI